MFLFFLWCWLIHDDFHLNPEGISAPVRNYDVIWKKICIAPFRIKSWFDQKTWIFVWVSCAAVQSRTQKCTPPFAHSSDLSFPAHKSIDKVEFLLLNWSFVPNLVQPIPFFLFCGMFIFSEDLSLKNWGCASMAVNDAHFRNNDVYDVEYFWNSSVTAASFATISETTASVSISLSNRCSILCKGEQEKNLNEYVKCVWKKFWG